jgi:hypothetical protein
MVVATGKEWSAVVARRLERHWLAQPANHEPISGVVRAMCGAHAQIMSAAELSIGLRTAGGTRQGVRRALWQEHTLVKTYGPRGTVHLLPAEDLSMWTGALSAVPGGSTMPPAIRLAPEQVDDVVLAITDALADTELTIDELSDEVVARTGPWAGDLVMPAFGGMWPRWRQVMGTAAHRGAFIFGPQRGRKVTYTNPRRWMPDFEPKTSGGAPADLLRHYLHAYGPATSRDYARWLSAPLGWANDLFAVLGERLEEVTIDGHAAWVNAGDADFSAGAHEGIRLLPYFDAYTVGSHPRAKVFPGRAAERALAGGQAGNFPVLLIDGVVAGVWHQRRSGKKITITVESLDVLRPDQRDALDGEVHRIGEILEATATWQVGPVTVGPHA